MFWTLHYRLLRILLALTRTAASLVTLASEALLTTFVVNAVVGHCQTVIRDESLFNQ